MPSRLSSHGARVARSRSEVIPEGDGVPSTHTPPPAAQHRKVTTGPGGRGPLPLAALSTLVAMLAVISMSAIVLTTATIAILRLYDTNPHRDAIAAGFLALIGVQCLVMAAAGLRGRQ